MDQCSDGDAGVGIISCAFRGTEQDGRFIGGGFGATILDKGIARSLIARHPPTGPYANGHLMQMCDLFIHLFRSRICAARTSHKIVANSARDSLVISFSELAKSSNFLSSQASSKRKSIHMITRRIAIFAALSVAFYPVLPALPASDPDLLAGLDTDNDGTVSLDEAKKAAEVIFGKLDRDRDGTLTGRELRDRLSAREFAAFQSDSRWWEATRGGIVLTARF